MRVKPVVESFIFLTILFFPMCCGLTLALGRAGFRPGGRDPFVSAKGPKTISAQVGTLNRVDASHGGADQLAESILSMSKDSNKVRSLIGASAWGGQPAGGESYDRPRFEATHLLKQGSAD